ncbi:MAG: flagellar motor switch protein FliN [Lentilitoribacter sp.]
MSSENAPENETNSNADNPEELDGAIDGLRDVLQQDAEGLDLSSAGAGDGALDIGSDFGGDIGGDLDAGGDLGGDLGADFGGDFNAAPDLGSDFGGDIGGNLGDDLGSDFGGGDALGSDFGAGSDLGSDFGGGSLESADPGVSDFGSGSSVTGATGSNSRADLVMDIPIDVQVVLGTSRMQVSELMDLNEGATIGLQRKIGEPVEIMVNGKLIGRGEITVLENDDTRFGVKMIEVIGTKATTG